MIREYTPKELKEIVAKAKSGDRQSFALIYEQFYLSIFRYVYGRSSDKILAEDLTQDVFLKGYKSLSCFPLDVCSPLAYFYTIARNSLIDHWRKKVPERLNDEQTAGLVDSSAHTDQLSLEKESEMIIQLGLNVLTDEQREIITLKYLNDLSNKEISDIVGKSEEAIRQNISRALRAMNKKLENYEY
jgi:RNA polymerase sigma-70 factor (ECF subfamily)